MNRRGWVGWLEMHRGVVAGLAFWTVISVTGVVSFARGGAGGGASQSAAASVAGKGNGKAGKVHLSARGHRGSKQGAAKPVGGGPSHQGSVAAPSFSPAPPIVPGASSRPACTPVQPKVGNGRDETGITTDHITLGQIITDSANIPSQFRPAYEGLMAYVKLANDRGGICGRTMSVKLQNDNSNPTQHDYQSLANQVFAFVANSSLFDGNDYQTGPPFDPAYRDANTGEFVPDVGGLAFSYGRAQSDWHAGVIGSVSPVLVGGGQFEYFVNNAERDTGHACHGAGVIYLVEPTGASKDQAELGKAALEADWGGGFGSGNVKEYSANLGAPDLVYRGIIENMIRDGVNCAFSYTDLQSNINLAKALYEEGVWPPDKCTRAVTSQCFGVIWVPFTAYDGEFVANGGEGARGVRTFIPQLPLNETSNPALRAYLDALASLKATNYQGACPNASSCDPSTYSVLGFASGMMFGDAVTACGGGPTRDCVISYLRGLQDFTAGGLLGGTTPFRRTTANSSRYGTFDWKWIFNASVAVRVLGNESDYLDRWHRIRPSSGFFHDTLHAVGR